MKKGLCILISVLVLAHSALAGQFTESITKKHGTLDFDYEQKFPSIDSITGKAPLARAPYGLYTWGNDWDSWYYSNLNQGPQFKEVELKTWRISFPYGQILPKLYMDNIVEFSNTTGSEILYTLYAVQRENFGAFENPANDQKFINAFLNYSNIMIGNYGPGGSYFKDNPGKPYKPILYWELLNEPNGFFMMGTGGEAQSQSQHARADLYAKLLIQFHDNVSKNPLWKDVKIVAMSGDRGGDVVSEGGLSWVDRVHERIVANGRNPNDVYDVLSDHPYIHDAPPDVEYDYGYYSKSIPNMFAEIKRVMAKYNVDKPIYFTEMGWSRSNGQFTTEGSLPWISEESQAAYVVRFYLISMRLGVDAVHVFMNTDADGHNCGFFDVKDFTHWYKQANATKNLVKVMPNPQLLRVINESKGYYSYVFDADTSSSAGNGEVTVIWNARGAKNVALDCTNDVKVIDILGSQKVAACSGGKMTLEVGPNPVYLIGGTTVTQCTEADTDFSNTIEIDELRAYIDLWKRSQVSMIKLMDAIQHWKNIC